MSGLRARNQEADEAKAAKPAEKPADDPARPETVQAEAETVQSARARVKAADVSARRDLEAALPAQAKPEVGPGTAVDGPGVTPPGERILDHDWVQSSRLGDAKIEEVYDTTSATRNWANKSLANVALGTDLDFSSDYPTKAVRFSYTTQDRGELKKATGVMIYPVTDEAKELPMMLTLHGYGGMNNESAPSGGWSDGENGKYAKLTHAVASSGKIVVMPDYIGLNSSGENPGQTHPMLVAEPTAVASLDAARAARNLLRDLNQMRVGDGAGTRVTPGDTVAWGGSQGGHAAAAVARYQPAYAPDVPLKAVGMSAPPLDVGAQLSEGVKNEKSLFHSAAVFMGMSDWYGIPPDKVFQGDYAQKIPAAFADGSPEEVEKRLEGLTAKEVLRPEVYAAALDPSFKGHPEWSRIMAENSLPHSKAMPESSGVPMHLAIASDDELVDPNVTRQSFEALVAQGDKVHFLECEKANHNEGAFAQTLDDSLRFLDQALSGRELPIGMGVRLNPVDCSD